MGLATDAVNVPCALASTRAIAGNALEEWRKKQYEGLRKKGMSKERAAKVANTPNASSKGGKKAAAKRKKASGKRKTSQGTSDGDH
jgi:uncharacterized protein YdaU (DUF1376 family)